MATEIAEWARINYGYFVNKDSDRNQINQNLSEQLERLPVGAMSYIQQTKNNFIDTDIKRPPSPAMFIQDLKICFNQNKKVQIQPVYVDKIKFIANKIYEIKGDENKIRFIKMLHSKGKLKLKNKSIASMEIEQVLKRNNFNECKIREIIGS
jgi:hypothetical protein